MRNLCAILIVIAVFVAPANAQRGAVQLPPGPGQEVIQAKCTQCHGLNLITNSAGFTRDAWKTLTDSMVKLPANESAAISEYLAKNFPEKPERRPSLVSGNAKIKITEWIVPTLGQRSRDPIEAPDGSIWWTGMWASLAGRLDPKTGEMKEYKTKAQDPHSAAFHPNGRLYFTAQNSRMIGRLSPETGEITEVPTEANPYGIQVAGDGTLWVAYNGTNKLGAVNPETLEIKYYEVPDTASRIRRLGFTSDGMVWYGNSRGRIGRLNPKTGEIKEWPSPSGPTSSPYAFTVVNDIVWYNESGMRPDALVRFDPKTERFQSWAIPSGFGIVRNFGVTKAGNLIIHQTSSNRIGLVEIQK